MVVHRSFSIQDAMAVGWNIFKANWRVLFPLAVLIEFLGHLPQTISIEVSGDSRVAVPFLVSFLSFAGLVSLISLGVAAWLALGVTYIALRLIAGESVALKDATLPGIARTLNFVLAGILAGVIVALGLVLVIVPGIYCAARLSFFPYFIVEDDAGPVEALRRSWALTNGVTVNVLVFTLLLVVINAIGLLPAGLGFVLTYPVSAVAQAQVYRQLREQSGLEAASGALGGSALMDSGPLAPVSPRPVAARGYELRYPKVDVFEQPDVQGAKIGELHQGEAFGVVSTGTIRGPEDEFYRVRTSSGLEGYVFKGNVRVSA